MMNNREKDKKTGKVRNENGDGKKNYKQRSSFLFTESVQS